MLGFIPFTPSARLFLDAIAPASGKAAPEACGAGANLLLEGTNLVRAAPAGRASDVARNGVHASGVSFIADPLCDPNVILFLVWAGVPASSPTAPGAPKPADGASLAGTLPSRFCFVAPNVNAGCADRGARMDCGIPLIADLVGGGCIAGDAPIMGPSFSRLRTPSNGVRTSFGSCFIGLGLRAPFPARSLAAVPDERLVVILIEGLTPSPSCPSVTRAGDFGSDGDAP